MLNRTYIMDYEKAILDPANALLKPFDVLEMVSLTLNRKLTFCDDGNTLHLNWKLQMMEGNLLCSNP